MPGESLARVKIVALIVLVAACDSTLVDEDDIYTRGAPEFVMCGNTIDDKASASIDAIGGALDRAQIDGTTVQLYAHKPGDLPGDTIEPSTIETVLAGVVERGMAYATYADLTRGEVPGSLALSFDDHDIAGWTALRPLFAHYHARVTFFVSAFLALTETERAQLHELAADGHDIEFHSTNHFHAPAYATDHGTDGYIADEIAPGLAAMRADGFAPTIFAYPFGERTAELDDALRPHFAHVRAIHATCPY